MVQSKRILTLMLVIFMTLTSAVMFSSCEKKNSNDRYNGMYLVVYDGNGGYLGNKTSVVRKLYCVTDSKLPGYYTEYMKDTEYVTSELGLAMRKGYMLMGWYTEGSGTYTADPNGTYVYLTGENGVYVYDPDGDHVKDYLESENGTFIYVTAEEDPLANDSGTDETETAKTSAESTTEYIYIDLTRKVLNEESGEEELRFDSAMFPDGSGFYVYSAFVEDYENEEAYNVYQEVYGEAKYDAKTVKTLKGFQSLPDLSAAFQTLFASLPRFVTGYRDYNADTDDGLDRYSKESQYVDLNNMMEENPLGTFVEVSGSYLPFDPENPDHAGLTRYSVNERYLFVPTATVQSPSDLEHFFATFKYWDFANDRVNADAVDENGTLTLYAHWVKKYTVYYHHENGTGQVDLLTTRLLDDNITYVDLKPGDILGKKESTPLFAGHTFVCWSKSPTEYDPWDFANATFPEGQSDLHLYAYYLEGDFTRITSAKGLEAIANNPSGNYVLCADINLGGKSYTKASPTGLTSDQVFTGKFVSFGYTISNFTMKLSNSVAVSSVSSAKPAYIGLFPKINNATISGVNVSCTIAFSGTKKDVQMAYTMYGGGISGGDVGDGTSVITDCRSDVVFTSGSGTIAHPLYVGNILGSDSAIIADCDGSVDVDGLTDVGTVHTFLSVKTGE